MILLMHEDDAVLIFEQIQTLGLLPVHTSASTHIYEERYELNDKLYAVYYPIDGDGYDIAECVTEQSIIANRAYLTKIFKNEK